jgi:hypothetical protein
MTRDEMLAEAKRRGIKAAHLMKAETLAERLGEPEVEPDLEPVAEPAPVAPPATASHVTVVILAKNLWTTDGREKAKRLHGETAVLPRAEAEGYAARKLAVIVGG